MTQPTIDDPIQVPRHAQNRPNPGATKLAALWRAVVPLLVPVAARLLPSDLGATTIDADHITMTEVMSDLNYGRASAPDHRSP